MAFALVGCKTSEVVKCPEAEKITVFKYDTINVEDKGKLALINDYNDLSDAYASLQEKYMNNKPEIKEKVVFKFVKTKTNSDNKNTNITDLQQKFDSINNLYLTQSFEQKTKSKEKTCNHLLFYIIIVSLSAIVIYFLFRFIV